MLAVGCAERNAAPPAAHAPMLEELPSAEAHERVIPASVGVEGRGDAPQESLAEALREPELTPEEKEAIGETDPPIDVLAFYRPERGPEHGVLPLEALRPAGVASWVRSRAGVEAAASHAGVDLSTPVTTYVAVFERTAAGVELRGIGPHASMYLETGFTTGSGPARSTAAAATKVDY
ncbi:MAG: hypothetical protein D6744_14800 [Planctomycetota bacterium]|nr:MAG: hypothetical protein D6744_14800 [Planctomycetota bacterium]